MNQYPDFDQKLYDDLRRGKEYAFAAVFERYNRLLYPESEQPPVCEIHGRTGVA